MIIIKLKPTDNCESLDSKYITFQYPSTVLVEKKSVPRNFTTLQHTQILTFMRNYFAWLWFKQRELFSVSPLNSEVTQTEQPNAFQEQLYLEGCIVLGCFSLPDVCW